jgi:hypothetical protein
MQLHSITERSYYDDYLTRYENARFYPGSEQGAGSEPLRELFQTNADEFLGR